jgi:CO/xanthine dehydrogenase Mo-binding subunit
MAATSLKSPGPEIARLQNGAPINSSMADYLFPVTADAPPIEVHFVDFSDKEINEFGARGIGEIGKAGIAAAITDAVQQGFVCANCR